MTFTGVVREGHIMLDQIDDYRALKTSLEGQRINLSLELMPVLPERARKYYFGVIVKRLAEFSGHTPAETHEGLKARFLMRRSGEPDQHVPSVTELSDSERNDFYDHCRVYLAQLGINLEPME